jgi:glucosamine--fructose-6-phosphate aminotransferase (isomerizing)
MECALLSCKSYSTADFQHGPKALAGHGSMAMVFGELPQGLEEQGCLVVQAPVFDGGASTPISEIIFGQWVALMAARARGLNPDDPRFLSKVTLTL